jgi:hypothetical protein
MYRDRLERYETTLPGLLHNRVAIGIRHDVAATAAHDKRCLSRLVLSQFQYVAWGEDILLVRDLHASQWSVVLHIKTLTTKVKLIGFICFLQGASVWNGRA